MSYGMFFTQNGNLEIYAIRQILIKSLGSLFSVSPFTD